MQRKKYGGRVRREGVDEGIYLVFMRKPKEPVLVVRLAIYGSVFVLFFIFYLKLLGQRA